MSRPLAATDSFIEETFYGYPTYTAFERQDGSAYKISGNGNVTEYASRQAFYAWKRGDGVATDPEGKGHKGATSDGGKLREEVADRLRREGMAAYWQSKQVAAK